MKVFRMQVPSISPITVVDRDIDDMLAHLRTIFTEEDSGKVTIEIVQMDSPEVDALPEFEGY
jgi:hypothetical protein